MKNIRRIKIASFENNIRIYKKKKFKKITVKIFSHPHFSKLLLGRVPGQQVGFQFLEVRFLPLVQFLRVAPPRVSITVRYDLVLASLRLGRLRAEENENFRKKSFREKIFLFSTLLIS